MNRTTKAEREQLIAKAGELLKMGADARTVEVQLQQQGISKQRARHAVARARLRMNRPNR